MCGFAYKCADLLIKCADLLKKCADIYENVRI